MFQKQEPGRIVTVVITGKKVLRESSILVNLQADRPEQFYFK